MKKVLLCLLLASLAISAKSQNCFNEYDNNVSALACVDAVATFEMNYYAAIIKQPQQDRFALYLNDKNYPLQSWHMMDRSGPDFNIHQYGFKDGDVNVIVVYKIVKRYTVADIAIIVAGQPYYHNTNASIYTNPKDDLHDIEGIASIGNKKSSFIIIMDGSDIVSVKIGDTMYVRHNNN